jgi:hypothetical protein
LIQTESHIQRLETKKGQPKETDHDQPFPKKGQREEEGKDWAFCESRHPRHQQKEPQPESASGNQQPGITSAAFGGETSK